MTLILKIKRSGFILTVLNSWIKIPIWKYLHQSLTSSHKISSQSGWGSSFEASLPVDGGEETFTFVKLKSLGVWVWKVFWTSELSHVTPIFPLIGFVVFCGQLRNVLEHWKSVSFALVDVVKLGVFAIELLQIQVSLNRGSQVLFQNFRVRFCDSLWDCFIRFLLFEGWVNKLTS